MSENLWNTVLTELKQQLNPQSFNLWLKDTELVHSADSTLTIKVGDDVARRHISEYYTEQIRAIIHSLTSSYYDCEFITESDLNVEKQSSKNKSPVTGQGVFFYDAGSGKPNQNELNPYYTFETFVVGPNNQLAHAASHSVAQAPATRYNPLFIYGKPGVGKTHLLQAIGNMITSSLPTKRVLYISSENFINDFIFSIRNNTQESFKIKYRDVDILLIDDIQFLEGKVETQNEFFHTFNDLFENKKQIVISSDRPPRDIAILEERLRTRFEWGMITDIQPPNLETREAILRNKAERLGMDIPEDVLNYIARRISKNIRGLESALNKLSMVASIGNEQLTISHAKTHLKELFDDDMFKKVSVSDILIKVAKRFNISVEDITSKSRQSRFIQPRFIAMYLARRLTELTTTELGKDFGDRDHSTILNGIKKIEDDMDNNTELREIIDELFFDLKS